MTLGKASRLTQNRHIDSLVTLLLHTFIHSPTLTKINMHLTKKDKLIYFTSTLQFKIFRGFSSLFNPNRQHLNSLIIT